ncbi:uncharacterized protein B0P05DRAFT_460347 [Gilbertella persicaria]|uniref:uncharacterized protein n=1 Tax=Gilbertella persicaria TaxID=101096 RepID=UPI002220EF7A|nr:uncharacterized protein B0P05DRAFT_460347 [Gilbertella persicaria]KAI8098417.1 hypothetical protein B0P05DRAFT_460347 [Gilbertella persicaria]
MFKSVFLVLSCSCLITALNVSSISDCPGLLPRIHPAQDVTDLRMDDIKIMASLGDSIMAGYGMENIPKTPLGFMNKNILTEFRGQNYMMGADEGAVSIANFIKHYSPFLVGPSSQSHPLGYVRGSFPLHYNYQQEWKIIHVHIGSNDLCRASEEEFMNATLPENYAKDIEAAIQRIQSQVPNVLVNLIGMLKVTDIQPLVTDHSDYCQYSILKQPCHGLKTKEAMERMDILREEYDAKLAILAQKYAAKPGGTFGVMFTPIPFDLTSFPIEAFSNIDCFHPSTLGHQWIAKAMWNQVFLDRDRRPSLVQFDQEQQIYCPTENDRIIIK